MVESLEYFLVVLLSSVARRVSFRTAGRAGAFLGNLVYTMTPIRKKVTHDNLEHAFPDLDRRAIRQHARAAFRNYGTAVLEMLWAGGQPQERLIPVVRPIDRKVVEELLAQGKGLIVLSGHFGAWELIVSSVRLHVGRPMVVIVKQQRNRKVDAFIDAHRRRFGNVTVPMGPSVREVLRTLKDGGIVAMLADQSGPKESVFVDFFGRPAATHRGVAMFSLRTGAPVLMCFLVREEDGTYRVLLEEVDRSGLDSPSDENILELTRRHTAVLEKYIRMYPDHWLWMHKRWKHTGYYQSLHPVGEAV